jgi:hypothetical protein
MIRKEGRKYVLYSSDGSKRLGVHPSKERALAQERAIQFAKAKRKGR